MTTFGLDGVSRRTRAVSRSATVITVAALFFHSMAAYAPARPRFPGREKLFGAIFATLLVTAPVVLIPLFLVARRLGLLDSYAGLIIPAIFNAFGIFLLRQFYLGLPKAAWARGSAPAASNASTAAAERAATAWCRGVAPYSSSVPTSAPSSSAVRSASTSPAAHARNRARPAGSGVLRGESSRMAKATSWCGGAALASMTNRAPGSRVATPPR